MYHQVHIKDYVKDSKQNGQRHPPTVKLPLGEGDDAIVNVDPDDKDAK